VNLRAKKRRKGGRSYRTTCHLLLLLLSSYHAPGVNILLMSTNKKNIEGLTTDVSRNIRDDVQVCDLLIHLPIRKGLIFS